MKDPKKPSYPQVILHNHSDKKEWDAASAELHAYTDQWVEQNECSLGYQVTGMDFGQDTPNTRESWNGHDPLFTKVHRRGEWVHRYTFMPNKIVIDQRSVGNAREKQVYIVVPATMASNIKAN